MLEEKYALLCNLECKNISDMFCDLLVNAVHVMDKMNHERNRSEISNSDSYFVCHHLMSAFGLSLVPVP